MMALRLSFFFQFNPHSIVSLPRVEAAPIAETVIWGRNSPCGCRLTKLITDALVEIPDGADLVQITINSGQRSPSPCTVSRDAFEVLLRHRHDQIVYYGPCLMSYRFSSHPPIPFALIFTKYFWIRFPQDVLGRSVVPDLHSFFASCSPMSLSRFGDWYRGCSVSRLRNNTPKPLAYFSSYH
jgi:hypothetical protein